MSGTPKDPFAHQNKDLDDLKREYGTEAPLPSGQIPVTWQDGHTGAKLKGRPLIVVPDAAENDLFSSSNRQICGGCKFFDLESGRKEIVRQRFAEKLLNEFEWKLKHVGSPDQIGLCGQSGGQLATTFISKACDHYRPRSRR